MATQPLSPNNDLRIITGGNLNIDLDGLGGVDTLDLGTQFQNQFSITKGADGGVHVDTLSGASEFFHATLYNWEVLKFGDGTSIDLQKQFPTSTPVTATLASSAQGKQGGSVTYTLAFSEGVTGLDASDFTVTNGSVAAVQGSGASYTVLVAPAAGVDGALGLTLKASSVTGSSGGTLANAVAAAAVAVDTQAPSLVSATPANAATGVALGSSVVLNFSEAIQKGSGSLVLKDASGAVVATYDVATSPLVVASGSSLSVFPSLASGTQYTLEVPAGAVKDAVGNLLSAAVATGFTTSGVKPTLVGTAGADKLTGTANNDVIMGMGGDDSIDALGGTDTAVYEGSRSSYDLKVGAGADGVTTVADKRVFIAILPGGDGTDSLAHVERLQFADQSLALDLGATQSAGKAVLMLGATLGPGILANQSLGGLFLGFFDTGASLLDGANLLVGAGIVAAFAGGADNTSFVKFVYNNVNGKAPDAATLAQAVAALDNHSTTQAQWMADLAASQANQDHVQLTGLAQTGWSFVA